MSLDFPPPASSFRIASTLAASAGLTCNDALSPTCWKGLNPEWLTFEWVLVLVLVVLVVVLAVLAVVS